MTTSLFAKVLKGFGGCLKQLILIVATIAAGTPWNCLGSWLGGQNAPVGGPRNVRGMSVASIGYLANPAVALAYAHATGVLGAFEAWEAALLGWAAGMTGLMLAQMWAQRHSLHHTKQIARAFR